MPPYSMPVSSTARSIARNDALRTSRVRLTRLFTSARVSARTTQAATRSSPSRRPATTTQFALAVSGDVVRLGHRGGVRQLRVDLDDRDLRGVRPAGRGRRPPGAASRSGARGRAGTRGRRGWAASSPHPDAVVAGRSPGVHAVPVPVHLGPVCWAVTSRCRRPSRSLALPALLVGRHALRGRAPRRQRPPSRAHARGLPAGHPDGRRRHRARPGATRDGVLVARHDARAQPHHRRGDRRTSRTAAPRSWSAARRESPAGSSRTSPSPS